MPAMMLTKKESAFPKCAEMILADQCPPDRKHYLCMAQEAAQDARRTFPEYFAGKSDQEIINEISEALKKEAGA